MNTTPQQIVTNPALARVTLPKGLIEQFNDWRKDRRAKRAFKRVGTVTFPIETRWAWSDRVNRQIVFVYLYQNGFGKRKIHISNNGYQDFVLGHPIVRNFLDGDSFEKVITTAKEYEFTEVDL